LLYLDGKVNDLGWKIIHGLSIQAGKQVDR